MLGPLEVATGAGPLPLTAPSQQVLLVALLVRANQVVRAERLIDDLWADALPAKPETALRMAISRLRRLLAAGDPSGRVAPLLTRPGGYVLRIDPEQLDANRFERLATEGGGALAAGDVELAAKRLGAGLALWRGAALADVPPLPVVLAEADRLEARRLAVLSDRIEADLARGRHAEVLAELQALTAGHPLDEGLCGKLMRALYQAGRQADALAAYRGLRRRLVDELGIEPGPSLQQLEQQILAADPELSPAAPERGGPGGAGRARAEPPRQLPPPAATFTGRQHELDRLRAVLVADMADERDRVVISAVNGAGGTGKSRLAVQAAHQVAERFPGGQLYCDLRGAVAGLAPLAPREVLWRFLRALGVHGEDVPEDADEAAAHLRSLLAGRRVLMVLDNAADAAQVRPLLPASPECAVLVTSRQMLSTIEGATHLHLGALLHHQAVELLERFVGAGRVRAEPAAAASIARLCGHLPLALHIVGARLAARPTWPLRALAERLADAETRLDELELDDLAVRASLEVSYHALRCGQDAGAQAAARLFRLLGLLDSPEVSIGLVAALLDWPPAAAEAALERLVDVCLVETLGPGRYRIHDLPLLFARERARREAGQPAAGGSILVS